MFFNLIMVRLVSASHHQEERERLRKQQTHQRSGEIKTLSTYLLPQNSRKDEEKEEGRESQPFAQTVLQTLEGNIRTRPPSLWFRVCSVLSH